MPRGLGQIGVSEVGAPDQSGGGCEGEELTGVRGRGFAGDVGGADVDGFHHRWTEPAVAEGEGGVAVERIDGQGHGEHAAW